MQLANITTTGLEADLNGDSVNPSQGQPPEKGTSLLRILSLNCSSIEGNIKNCEFRALINQHDPYVILGRESKIDGTFPTYSLLRSHYTEVYRKGHTRNGGEVFCAIREDVLATEEKDLAKDNECVWSCIQFPKSQKVYLGSFYRPPRAPPEHLEKSLTELHTKCMRRHPNVIIAGDFTAADITWNTNGVIGSSDTVNARKLLAITEQFNLTQHQREITRPSSDVLYIYIPVVLH